MSPRAAGRLRIIGGAWRSRVIDFVAGEGVRPTPDRVRQTLFDWLAPRIEGSVCLDLFAGSGALGLEALSRGASRTCFVEQGAAQCAGIRTALEKLQAGPRATLLCSDALRWAAQQGAQANCERFDIVFLDPPYACELLQPALALLPTLLKTDSRIYVEWPGDARPALPAGFEFLREKKAGQVSFGLLTYSNAQGVNA